MKPVEIGVGFFGGGGGEQLPVKKTTRTLQTGKGMVFFFIWFIQLLQVESRSAAPVVDGGSNGGGSGVQ